MFEETHVDERRSICMLFGLTDEINISDRSSERIFSVWNKRNLPLSRDWMMVYQDDTYVRREQ